jgi:hypothetical protein
MSIPKPINESDVVLGTGDDNPRLPLHLLSSAVLECAANRLLRASSRFPRFRTLATEPSPVTATGYRGIALLIAATSNRLLRASLPRMLLT